MLHFCLLLPSGLIPRLLGDVLSLWICNLLAHLINTYAIDDSVRPLLKHDRAQGKVSVLPTELCLKGFIAALHSFRLCRKQEGANLRHFHTDKFQQLLLFNSFNSVVCIQLGHTGALSCCCHVGGELVVLSFG